MNHSSSNRLTSSRSTKSNNHISGNSNSTGGGASLIDSDLWRNFVKSITNPHPSDLVEHTQNSNFQPYESQQQFHPPNNHEQNSHFSVLNPSGSINTELNQFSNNSSFINSPWWDNDDATDDPDFTICHADLEDADLDFSFQVPSKTLDLLVDQIKIL